MNREIKQLIYKYVSGALTDDEAVRLAEWTRLSPQNGADFRSEVRRLESQLPTTPAARAFCARLTAERRRMSPQAKSAPAQQTKTTASLFGGAVRAARRYSRAIAVVAIVAVALGATTVLVSDNKDFAFGGSSLLADSRSAEQAVAEPVIYTTGMGERRSFTLPDSTRVTLNANARLTLAADFGVKERRVMLDGECYFEVAKNPACRFVVACGDKEYIVRGTSFNIVSYSADRYSVVTLHTGRLEAHVREDVIQLNPGDELRMDDNLGQIAKQTVAVENSISWIHGGRLRFTELPLKFVASRMAHKYNIKIHIHSSIENIPYDGQIDNESLEEALRLVSLTAPVPLAINEFDGEYYVSKRANH